VSVRSSAKVHAAVANIVLLLMTREARRDKLLTLFQFVLTGASSRVSVSVMCTCTYYLVQSISYVLDLGMTQPVPSLSVKMEIRVTVWQRSGKSQVLTKF
jgi:hypothetical protein